ncbi:MAG: hypothetical protein QOE90_2197 [Thermoplasmata archaeon]|jgi:hypothetical protein|nr:hypothetical protein [Thermoplasmata archaeon]
MRTVVLAVAIASLLAPVVTAVPAEKLYGFTDAPNAGVLGSTLALAQAGAGSPVALAPNVATTWAYPTALATAAAFHGGSFAFDLYLTSPSGSVKAIWGYMALGLDHQEHFTPLKASNAVNVARVPRAVVANVGHALGAPLPPTGTSVDIGHATVTLSGIDGEIPRGAYPAIQIIASNSNGLYPTQTTLGATADSTATIPMPELPALVLLGLGATALGAVVLVRTRKGWM